MSSSRRASRGCRPGGTGARFAEIALHIQQRLVTLADAPGVVDFLFAVEPEIDPESWDKTFDSGVGWAAAGRRRRGLRWPR